MAWRLEKAYQRKPGYGEKLAKISSGIAASVVIS